jgi:hypothetical protein
MPAHLQQVIGHANRSMTSEQRFLGVGARYYDLMTPPSGVGGRE